MQLQEPLMQLLVAAQLDAPVMGALSAAALKLERSLEAGLHQAREVIRVWLVLKLVDGVLRALGY